MKRIPHALHELSIQQSGVASMRQLAAHGFSPRDVHTRMEHQLWQRVSATVVALHAQPLNRKALLWAASLHFERCALAGSSSLEWLGLPEPPGGVIHLIGPRQGLVPPMSGCVLHTRTCEFAIDRQPDRTPVAESVLQALRWAVTDRQGVFQAVWALQQRHTDLETLTALSREVRAAPGSSVMRRRLRLIDPGVHSIHEFDFAKECRNRGLPQPIRQRERVDSRGRRRYTDAEFVVDGRTLVVEIDGLAHLEASVHLDDQFRANELMLQGAPVFRIPGLALRLDADRVFDQLRRALRGLRRIA